MTQLRLVGLVLGAIALVLIVVSSAFVITPREQALVLQFGEAKHVITEPGLYFKVPLLQNVIYIDKRVLDVETASEELITSDQKRLVVDAFGRYKIVDPLKYYQSLGSDQVARSRLQTFLNSSLRQVLGSQSFLAVLSLEREAQMRQIRTLVNDEAQRLGIDVIDVRIRRADLPEANSQAIYRRMQAERERQAKQARAEGDEEAQRIRARADREVTVLKAEARRQAEILQGSGDAERSKVFADAFGRDPGFYNFYRAMQAYERSLKPSDTLVLAPDSDFFRYFGSIEGQKAAPRGR